MCSEKKLGYDATDEESILSYAFHLEGQTLNEAIPNYERTFNGGRGTFGLILETGYFGLDRNNESRPDFEDAGIELKSSPLKRLRNGELRAKERISLSMIDYNKLAYERGPLYSTSFWSKINRMLLVFYEYSQELSALDYPIRVVSLWEFPHDDKLVLAKDWELIKSYVDKGQAHLLSEGLTNYLGAATKGASSNDLTSQPNSPEMAMRRAFSLKTSYVNRMVKRLLSSPNDNLFSSLTSQELSSSTIEEAFIRRAEKFIGKSVNEICEHFSEEQFNMSSYSVYSKITKFMLGSSNKNPLELIQADIKIKTIRLKSNGVPKEAVSFPSFKYEDIIEESWFKSNLFEMLDSKKYLFSVFAIENDDLVFKGIRFWSMPYADIQICGKVWEDTRNKIQNGQIVKKITPSRRVTNFIKSSDEMKIHVRPHARNAQDTYPLPFKDQRTGLREYTKHSFWLNSSYLAKILKEEEL
jgi:DNA mismatch repair protein MutH